MAARRGGIISLTINGETQLAKGDFTYNIGSPKREPVVGMDRPHGFKETPVVPFIEGEITDAGTVDLAALTKLQDAVVTLTTAVGKVIALRDAWYAADGDVNTGEGNIQVRFEGLSAEELTV